MDSNGLLPFELLGLDHRLLQVPVYLTGQVHIVYLVMVRRGDENPVPANDDVLRPAGYLNDLSLQHRLSRITTSQNVLSFEPYLLGYQMSNQAATSAGLWIEDKGDLDLLPAWTQVWPGSPVFSAPVFLLLCVFTRTPVCCNDHYRNYIIIGSFKAFEKNLWS
jgi:hypothetical protein